VDRPALSPAHRALGLLIALAACLGVGGIGGWLTSSSVDSWYPTLVRPAWTPPGWLFGPVWTALYAAMAVSAWLAWRAGAPRRALGLFAAQLACNLAWSALFFGLRSPLAGLIDIVLLLGLIAATAVAFARSSRPAALLLVPYGLWVAFATALNAAIWALNR
jgi:tryptophan-rich sensory protein